jgi:hypothetical protein
VKPYIVKFGRFIEIPRKDEVKPKFWTPSMKLIFLSWSFELFSNFSLSLVLCDGFWACLNQVCFGHCAIKSVWGLS